MLLEVQVMPDIFCGLNKLSDDDIRLQIALIQSVTVGNAVKETSLKMVGKIVDFANMFTGKTDDSVNKINYQAKGVEDIVISQIKALKNSSRHEIDEIFRNILIEKCNVLNMNSTNENSSDDLISILVIREAAKVYSLNPYMSPASLADSISEKYYEQFLNRLHKDLLKELPEQAKITDNNLQQYLNKAPIELIRSMSKKIILKELSGRGIGRLIRTEVGIKNIKAVVECIGLEAFDVLKTAISSVYDTVLGVHRVPRAIFAQLVWVSVNAYGKKFTVNRDSLPNYIPANVMAERNDEEIKYFLLISNRKDLTNKIRINNSEIEKLTSKFMNLEEKLQEEYKAFHEFKEKFEELESKKGQYNNDIDKPKEEIKKYYADVISTKRYYDYADLNVKKYKKLISDINIKLSQVKSEVEQYDREFAVVNANANVLITQNGTKLEILWHAYFYRFRFDTSIFEQVVINFKKAEILKIEEYLKEMQDSVDLEAYSMKTIVSEDKNEDKNEDENQDENKDKNETNEEAKVDKVLKCAVCMVSDVKNAEIVYNNINIKLIRGI